jgi:nitroreductase
LEITREDKEKRTRWGEKGIRFYDAPAGIIVSADRSLNVAQLQFDIGIITQTICLVAVDYGLGTCIQRQNIMYPDVIRKFTGIPDTKYIVIAIAIGYPDWDFPANKKDRLRDTAESLTTWCGFD